MVTRVSKPWFSVFLVLLISKSTKSPIYFTRYVAVLYFASESFFHLPTVFKCISDIRRCYTLFLDEKRSTDYLKEYQEHFLYGSNVDDDTQVPKMEIA